MKLKFKNSQEIQIEQNNGYLLRPEYFQNQQIVWYYMPVYYTMIPSVPVLNHACFWLWDESLSKANLFTSLAQDQNSEKHDHNIEQK